MRSLYFVVFVIGILPLIKVTRSEVWKDSMRFRLNGKLMENGDTFEYYEEQSVVVNCLPPETTGEIQRVPAYLLLYKNNNIIQIRRALIHKTSKREGYFNITETIDIPGKEEIHYLTCSFKEMLPIESIPYKDMSKSVKFIRKNPKISVENKSRIFRSIRFLMNGKLMENGDTFEYYEEQSVEVNCLSSEEIIDKSASSVLNLYKNNNITSPIQSRAFSPDNMYAIKDKRYSDLNVEATIDIPGKEEIHNLTCSLEEILPSGSIPYKDMSKSVKFIRKNPKISVDIRFLMNGKLMENGDTFEYYEEQSVEVNCLSSEEIIDELASSFLNLYKNNNKTSPISRAFSPDNIYYIKDKKYSDLNVTATIDIPGKEEIHNLTCSLEEILPSGPIPYKDMSKSVKFIRKNPKISVDIRFLMNGKLMENGDTFEYYEEQSVEVNCLSSEEIIDELASSFLNLYKNNNKTSPISRAFSPDNIYYVKDKIYSDLHVKATIDIPGKEEIHNLTCSLEEILHNGSIPYRDISKSVKFIRKNPKISVAETWFYPTLAGAGVVVVIVIIVCIRVSTKKPRDAEQSGIQEMAEDDVRDAVSQDVEPQPPRNKMAQPSNESEGVVEYDYDYVYSWRKI